MPYGATRQQWAHWSLILGLTADLLPVVSNPGATIAGESTLKTLGKVPSRYNARGLVVGIKDWTKLQATAAQVEAWSRKEDYGICLQTRSVRAIDVDVDDLGRVSDVRQRLYELLGLPISYPLRRRPGSARFALAIRVDPGSGSLAKRIVVLASGAGAIELLADGQQFIVGGTHNSGDRYYWEGGEPDEIPTVTLERLDACWAALAAEFGTEPYRPVLVGGRRGAPAGELGRLNGVDRALGGVDDPVAVWLAARGWVVGQDEAKLWVACPWAAEHTQDTGGSSTCWFVAGTGGYEQGHFECLHAHCARRSDAEFLEAVGYEQSFAGDFSVIEPEAMARGGAGAGAWGALAGLAGGADAAGVDRAGMGAAALDARAGRADGPMGVGSGAGGALAAVGDPTVAGTGSWALAGPGQGLTRDRRGKWEATATNLTRQLGAAGWWRRIQRDTFRQELFWSEWGGEGAGRLVPWAEEDFTRARMALEAAGFAPIKEDMLRAAIKLVARNDAFDSPTRWLRSLTWDGVDRITQFLAQYFGAERSMYATAVSRYLWTALAGRVLEPGCKADMVPILVGAQGVGKSSGIEALAPHRDFYTTMDLAERDADLSRCQRGALVAELVELRGLRSREHESIKAFISQRADRWVPKYEETAITVQRRYLMIGTTNDDDFLSDDTGNRRWLPIAVGAADTEVIERDREQLWAQAAALFDQSGVAWQEAELQGAAEHDKWEEQPIWLDQIEKWLAENQPEMATTNEVLQCACGIDTRSIRNYDQKQCVKALKKLGWKQKLIGVGLKRVKKWFLIRQ